MLSKAGVFDTRVGPSVVRQRIVNNQIVADQCYPMYVSIDNFTVYDNFYLISLIFVPPIRWTCNA